MPVNEEEHATDPYELLFENAPVAIWLEDFSRVFHWLAGQVGDGRTEIASLLSRPAAIHECIRRIRILHVNRRAREFYGASTSNELKINFEALFNEESLHVFREELLAFWNGKSSFEADIEAYTLRGESRRVMMNCAMLPRPGERWSFVIVTFTDVTERHRLEQSLRESEVRAQEYASSLLRLNHDLERFAYAAAHDLREPLRTVSLYTQLLMQLQGPQLSDRAATAARFILDGTRRMEQLISDMLGYALTLDATVHQASPQTDTSAVIREAVANLDAAIREADAALTTEALPHVAVERGHMQQLLQNLIGNAVKYRSLTRRLAIHISARHRDDRVILCVSDNGAGIRPEYQTRIFEVFRRLHGPEIQGSGIGLALCRRIVEQYHGSIWVESDGISGSTFCVDLPAVCGTHAAAGE